ncbi:MAG: hypothetical protein IPJ82_07340 [Lewinellaceae bacterium]|nr:hypothetical protein [Lewinellaceae bacterium]
MNQPFRIAAVIITVFTTTAIPCMLILWAIITGTRFSTITWILWGIITGTRFSIITWILWGTRTRIVCITRIRTPRVVIMAAAADTAADTAAAAVITGTADKSRPAFLSFFYHKHSIRLPVRNGREALFKNKFLTCLINSL